MLATRLHFLTLNSHAWLTHLNTVQTVIITSAMSYVANIVRCGIVSLDTWLPLDSPTRMATVETKYPF
jgi:hypothetical protein